ncbi:MAG: hypothetical protein P4L73_01275 [Caulobacteraceae bacterium]|nr:hypothetical protein [Caulobacteraceae bacterium]
MTKTSRIGLGLIAAACLAAGAAFAEPAPPAADNVPGSTGRLDVPFAKALRMMLNNDGGGGGIGYTTAGPVFTAPALTDSQLKAALPGNTIRRELAWAAYFDPDGTVEGWKRDWSKADMSKCPTPLGYDYEVEDGACYTAVKNVISGKYEIRNGQVCMPAYSGKPEDGRACYYIAFITAFAVIGDGKTVYGGGKDFVKGKVLESYTTAFNHAR